MASDEEYYKKPNEKDIQRPQRARRAETILSALSNDTRSHSTDESRFNAWISEVNEAMQLWLDSLKDGVGEAHAGFFKTQKNNLLMTSKLGITPASRLMTLGWTPADALPRQPTFPLNEESMRESIRQRKETIQAQMDVLQLRLQESAEGLEDMYDNGDVKRNNYLNFKEVISNRQDILNKQMHVLSSRGFVNISVLDGLLDDIPSPKKPERSDNKVDLVNDTIWVWPADEPEPTAESERSAWLKRQELKREHVRAVVVDGITRLEHVPWPLGAEPQNPQCDRCKFKKEAVVCRRVPEEDTCVKCLHDRKGCSWTGSRPKATMPTKCSKPDGDAVQGKGTATSGAAPRAKRTRLSSKHDENELSCNDSDISETDDFSGAETSTGVQTRASTMAATTAASESKKTGAFIGCVMPTVPPGYSVDGLKKAKIELTEEVEATSIRLELLLSNLHVIENWLAHAANLKEENPST